MIEHHLILNAIIVTRRVIMLDISPKRTMVHATTLEATTSLMIKDEEMIEGMIAMEEMKEEEMLQVNMKNIVILKRSLERYESNVGKQSKYILISALTSSSPPDSWDNWFVDSVE